MFAEGGFGKGRGDGLHLLNPQRARGHGHVRGGGSVGVGTVTSVWGQQCWGQRMFARRWRPLCMGMAGICLGQFV